MKYLVAFLILCLAALTAWMLITNPSNKAESYYGRALFGKDAADASAWLHFIVQGEKVFIDRNRNNVADSDELFVPTQAENLKIGNRQYSLVAANTGIAPDAVSDSLPQSLMLQVEVDAQRDFTMSGKMHVVNSPERCNWLHFGGDLQFLVMDQPSFRAGAETPAELKIFIGSVAGGPPGSSPSLVDGSIRPDTFRTTIIVPDTKPPFPTVDIQFEGSTTESETIEMDQFC